MIPQGVYRAKAVSGVWGESKQKGTPFVRVSFSVVDGEHAGSIVTWDGFFTPNTQERAIESLRYCGCVFPGDNITDLAGLGDSDVSIVVNHETYENKEGQQKTRAKVDWVNSLGGGIPEDQRMDDGQKRNFAARMKGTLVASRKGAPAPNGVPAPTREQRPVAAAEDDIPF